MGDQSTTPPTYGIMIANWNGEAFIERCLGTVLAAVRRTGLAMDVLVVDDASADRSVEMIRAGFPQVRLLALERNVGFGQAVNTGLRSMNNPWVFLLNNDLALAEDFFERLIAIKDAHDPATAGGELFAIGAQTRDWESQEPNHGGQNAVWSGGMIRQQAFEAADTAPTVFFQAGACLLDRGKFLELGCFPDIYHPGYWEDYDLSWQAAARGWICLYAPGAVAYHWGKGSMKRLLGAWGVSLMLRRNHLLFVWANLSDPALLIGHLLGLVLLVLRDQPGPEQAGWARALWEALGRLGPVLRLRRDRKPERRVSDRAILARG